MKTIASLIAVALLAVGLSVHAQPVPPATNNVSNPVWYLELMDQMTNIAIVPYAAYNQDTHKAGGGIMAVYNVTANLGTGIGIEGMGSKVQVLNGNLELQLPIHPLRSMGYESFALVPWLGAFLGTPVGGAGNDNGGLAAGVGGGLYCDLFSFGKDNGWKFGLGGGAVKWTGGGKDWDGVHILGFAQVHHGF